MTSSTKAAKPPVKEEPSKEPTKETPKASARGKKGKESSSLRKFRVNHGHHTEQVWVEATQEEIENDVPGIVERKNGKHYRHTSKTYFKGEVIETERDLNAFNARGPMGPKFSEILSDKEAKAYQSQWDTIETLDEAKLRALATLEEIDLSGANGREEVLERLRQVVEG